MRAGKGLASAALAATSVLALSGGCGYTLVGTGRGILPEGAKTVYVEEFVNQTARVGLEQRITDAVLRELSSRARLKPTASAAGADLELRGRLLSYFANPVRFDDQGRALEYEIAVTAKVTLIERSSEKVLFENPSFVFRQPYTVPASTTTYIDVENTAIDALARPFAQSLVTTLLEGF